LIVNDRVDVALEIGADGVHVGQQDMDAERARRLLGPGAIIGLSIETVEQARAAVSLDVDYLGVGPVFATATKMDAAPPLGLEGLAQVRAISRRPIVAIAGSARKTCARRSIPERTESLSFQPFARPTIPSGPLGNCANRLMRRCAARDESPLIPLDNSFPFITGVGLISESTPPSCHP